MVVLLVDSYVLCLCRLSDNAARRGSFSLKGEDNRWAGFKTNISSSMFNIFDFGFIALTQNVFAIFDGSFGPPCPILKQFAHHHRRLRRPAHSSLRPRHPIYGQQPTTRFPIV